MLQSRPCKASNKRQHVSLHLMPKAYTIGVAICAQILVEVVLQRSASKVVCVCTYVVKDSLLKNARRLVSLVAILSSQCRDQVLPQRQLVVVAVYDLFRFSIHPLANIRHNNAYKLSFLLSSFQKRLDIKKLACQLYKHRLVEGKVRIIAQVREEVLSTRVREIGFYLTLTLNTRVEQFLHGVYPSLLQQASQLILLSQRNIHAILT